MKSPRITPRLALTSFDVIYQGGVYWVFLDEFPTKVEVMEFNPGSNSLTHLADIPSPVIGSGATKSYTSIHVRGDSSPVLIGAAINSSTKANLGYDLVGVGGIDQGGTPAVINIPNSVAPDTETGDFEAYVSGSTAYLYRALNSPGTPTGPSAAGCAADTINISCIEAAQNSPPNAGLTVQNVSAHFGSDPTNYGVDSYKINDTSTSGAPITAYFCDMDFSGSFSADTALVSSSFNAVLPCKSSSGNCFHGSGLLQRGLSPTRRRRSRIRRKTPSGSPPTWEARPSR